MKIMVVGGGGREHAIIKKLNENKDIEKIYALPGNGGMKDDAQCVAIGAKDIPAIVEFAKKNSIDFAVVAPDDPLVLGCVDALEEIGVPCFGPRANAAIIEGSKVFSKNLMKKYGIPTAEYEVFSDMDAALEYLKTAPIPTVVKADGLALGKGVLICFTREEAFDAVKSIMGDKVFGESGSNIVIEEFLTGPEVSVLSFTDGKTLVPMVSSMDHKRALDNDEGLNTGGMGTIAPNPYYTEDIAKLCMEKIFLPTMEAMNKEGRTFKGCLYFGLMLTPNGPKVIEYNCRFGDPETHLDGSVNCYDDPTTVTPVATNYIYAGKSPLMCGDDCYIIRNNDLRLPQFAVVRYYAYKLCNIDRAIDVNIEAQKTPTLVKCTDKQRLSLKQAINQRRDNEPVMYVDESLDMDAITTLDLKPPMVFKDLQVQKHMVLNEFFTDIGVNNANMDKRERMVANEVEANNEQVKASEDVLLRNREEACKQINRIFGLNISVRRRELDKIPEYEDIIKEENM